MRRPLAELCRSLRKRKISRRSKKPRADHTVAPAAAGIITGCAGMAAAGVLPVEPASVRNNMGPPKLLAASFAFRTTIGIDQLLVQTQRAFLKMLPD
jgi:hypothetical protein